MALSSSHECSNPVTGPDGMWSAALSGERHPVGELGTVEVSLFTDDQCAKQGVPYWTFGGMNIPWAKPGAVLTVANATYTRSFSVDLSGTEQQLQGTQRDSGGSPIDIIWKVTVTKGPYKMPAWLLVLTVVAAVLVALAVAFALHRRPPGARLYS